MNKINKTTAAILCGAMMLSSCSTTSKMSFSVPAGSTVINPSAETVCVGGNGQVPVEIKDKTYYPYLIAQDPATGLNVPFGINVHRNKYMGEKLAFGTGIGLSSVGIVGILTGALMLCVADDNDDEILNTALGITLSSTAASGLGLALAAPGEERLRQTMHHYQMAYDKNQSVSFDGLSATLINPDAPKEVAASSETATKKRRAASGTNESVDNSTTTVTKRGRGDVSAKVAGTYICKGALYKGTTVDEEYSDVRVEITRVDKNHVAVRVIESGEDFFAKPLEYAVSSEGSEYHLTIANIPSATIAIGKNGDLKFLHEAVNIDGEIFKLDLVGSRK